MLSPATKRLINIGGPFITLMVVGSYGLTYFTDIRYWITRNKKRFSEPTEEEKRRFQSASEIYEEEVAGKIFNDWENIRAPRPWEPETIRANEERARQLRQQQIADQLKRIEERAIAAEKEESQ